MNTETPSQKLQPVRWGFLGTLVWGVLVTILYVAVQIIVTLIYAEVIHGDMSEDLLKQIEYDGTVLSIATFATLLICGLMVCGIIKLKKNTSLKEYLALNKISFSQAKFWIIATIALIILIDGLTLLLGKPIVVEFMIKIYNSTSQPLLLFLALIFAAPVFEELFFRGFLFSGFRSTSLGPIGATIITSAAWSAIHLQYDLYGIFTIFIVGIVLAIARLKTNSILTTIMMHSVMNFIATIETIIYVAQ